MGRHNPYGAENLSKKEQEQHKQRHKKIEKHIICLNYGE